MTEREVYVSRINATFDDVVAHADRFDMRAFVSNRGQSSHLLSYGDALPGYEAPSCGTTMCFAGFAMLRAFRDESFRIPKYCIHTHSGLWKVPAIAQEYLGLDYLGADLIFFTNNWSANANELFKDGRVLEGLRMQLDDVVARQDELGWPKEERR